MASEIIAYVAVSIDGYVADTAGEVHFLEQFGSDEYGYHAFFETIEGLVMGATTYEQVLGFGWPYGDRRCLVLTHRELAVPDGVTVTFSSGDTGSAIHEFADGIAGRVWVVGGGRVITEAINAGAVDTLEMYLMPVALGSGVPLFSEPIDGALGPVEATAFGNGVVRLSYDLGSRE